MPPPTKEYIANVYGALADAYKDFDKTPQEFEAMISSDADYRSRVYGALKDGYADFDKTPAQFDMATIGGVVPEPPKGDIASQLLGKMDNKPSRGDMASLPDQPDLRVERLREALPAMKEKKVKDITANNLLSKGVVTPEGSKAYNEERTQVQANLKDEDWMPSHFLKNTEAVKQKAIEQFAFNSKETPDVVKQKIAKGEYMFDEGKVKVTGGFGDNFVQSLKDFMGNMKLALDIEGAKANRNTDAEAAQDIKNILTEFNRKRGFEQETGANTIGGHAGKTAGGIAPYMLPYADIPLMGISNMGANNQEIWADPTMSDDQKVMAINQSAKDAFMIGAAQGAAFRAMHAGEPPVTAASLLSKYAPTAELKQKFATSLYNNYRAILSATPKDVAKVALVGAGTEVANAINRASVGAKVDFSKVPESALDLAALDLLMKSPKILTSAFASIKEARRSGIDKIDPKWYNAYNKQTQDALNAIVSAPEAIYQQALSHIADSPDVNAQSAKLKIETFRGYYNSLPADLPEAAKAKALHILQLKTEAMDDMSKTNEPAIRDIYEKKALSYDGLLQKLVADKDIDTKKEPLLIDRFAKPAPPPEPPTEATEPIAPEPVKPAPKPQKPVVVAAPVKAPKDGYTAGTLADFNGKDVRYNGEPATLAIDEGGKVTAETKDRIYEIPDAKPEDRIEQHGMQEPKHVVTAVTNDAATVNDVKYNIHTDEKGNVVAVSPFNNPKQQITNEPLIKAVEIARNRQDVKEIHATINENADHVEHTVVDSGISNQTTVNALLGINMNETVDKAMTKLESGEKLTDQEALQLEVWGYDAIERLSKHDDAATKDTQEGILNILDELHQTHNNEQRASTETNSQNAPEPKGAGIETKVAGNAETKTETQTIKADAIPEPSAAPVLQRQPEETGVAGGERPGVEPIVKGAAPAGESAPRQEGGTGDGKTEPKVKKPRVFKPSTRQDKVNSLIDDVNKHNDKMRKGTPERRAAANEIKLRATELGLTWEQDRTSGVLVIVSKNRKPVQRRFAGSGSAEVFDKTNYSPETHDLVKSHLDQEGGLLGLAVQGSDGRFLDEKQKAAALQDIRDGKDTARAKGVYDSMQSMVDGGHVEFRDNETGEITPVPVAEYLAEIKKEKPLADKQIEENYPSLWDDGQEDLFSETQQPAGTTADEGAPKTGTEADHKEADGQVPTEAPLERITNKAEAKKVADKWRDIANNIEHFKFGDGAMLDVTALPRYIIGKAIKGAAEIIEASGSIADAVAHVAQKLREYYDEKDISYKASETKKAATDILKTVGLIPGAPPRVTKSAINETVETGKIKGDKVTMSQREALKKQIKDFARGFLEGAKKGKSEGIDIGLDAGIKAGVKAGVKRGVHIEKDAQRDFYEGISKFLKDAHFNGKLTESQAKALARKAAKVGTNTNRLVDFIEYTSKVIDDIHYAQKEADAKQLQKQIGKYVRSSKTFTNNVDILRALKRIPIGKLSPEHLDEFLRIAKEYRDAQLSPTNENYQPFNTTKNAIALEKIQKQLQIDADNQLINKAEELSGVLFLSADEAKVMLEALAADDVDKYAENLSDAKQKQLSAALLQRAEYSQMAVRQSLVDSDYIDQVHPRAAAMMERIAKADLTGLSDKKLVETIKALDNALLNGVPANLGRIDAMVQVHQNIPVLEKVTSANKKFSLNRVQEALEDLPVLMKAIYGLSGTVAEVRRLTGFDQVFNGGSIAKKAFLDKFKEYDKFLKENNISKKPDDVLRRGMYGHAIQHEGGTPEEINARFANNKRLIEQSIEAYGKRDSTKDLAVRLQAIYDADFKKFDKLDDLMTHFAANRVEDVKAQQFFEKAFEGMKDDIQYVTEAYHNELFEGNTVNYTPRGYNFVDRELNHQPGEPAMRFNNYVGKPPQSATSIKRVVEKNLPTGMALDFNFDYQMLKQYKKAQYDIQTTAGQFVFSEFMKRSESADILGGGDNKERFKNQYTKAEAIQGGQSAENDVASGIFRDVTDAVRNVSTTAALGSFTAYPKQYISVAVKTMGTLGSDAGMFFDVQKIKLKDLPLLAQTSIVMRGENQGGTNTGNKEDVLRNKQISDNIARNSLRWVSEKSGEVRGVMMKSLEEGDVRVAKRSFLAYYMKYLKDNGVSIKAEDLYTEHERLDEVRQKALSYAQQMVDESQVVSNNALMSDFKRPDRNYYKEIARTVLLPFNTFASNTRARMIEDGKFVFSGDSQQRKEALVDIGTSVAEIVTYQAINAFVLQAVVKYPLHELLEKVFGVEDSDPKTFGDRMMKEWKKFYTNVLKDTVISGFGNTAENGALQGLNQLGWYIHKTTNPDEQMPKHEWIVKNAPLFVYEKISPSAFDQMGAFGVYPGQLQNMPNDLRAAITGTGKAENSYLNEATVEGQSIRQTTELNKDVQLNANEQRFMMWQSLLDIASLGGFSDAEIKRITEAKKREILMHAGRNTKTSKTLYRELRHGK